MTGGQAGPPPDGHDQQHPRWRDVDWWFGRTPQQRARKDAARQELREARAEIGAAWRQDRSRPANGHLDMVGRVGRFLTLAVTVPILGAMFFGPLGLVAGIAIALLTLRSRSGG